MLSEFSTKFFHRFFAIFGYHISISNFFYGVVDSGKNGESLKRIKRAFFSVNLYLNESFILIFILKNDLSKNVNKCTVWEGTETLLLVGRGSK